MYRVQPLLHSLLDAVMQHLACVNECYSCSASETAVQTGAVLNWCLHTQNKLTRWGDGAMKFSDM